jgi:hypothetical protein
MADPTSAAQLYASVTQLAYAETQMAISPRPPFGLADRPDLKGQATQVADCAAGFRQKDPGPLSQQALFGAIALVGAALAMFAAINNQVSNTLAKAQVLSAVAAAVQAVDAL